MAELLRITPQDNVAVALTALSSGQTVTVDGIALTTVTDVPAGHKVALFPIKAGEKVIKYGFPIGYAKEDIPVGAHVHVHNLHTGLSGELTYEYHPTYPTIPEIPTATFMGYPRKDGRVGVRNELWILPTVGCAHDSGGLSDAPQRRRRAGAGAGLRKFQRRHHRGAHGRLRQVARAFPRLPAGGR